MDRPTRIVRFGIALVLVSVIWSATPTVGAGAGDERERPVRLSEIGIEFERVMTGPISGRAEKLSGTAVSLDALIKEGLERDRKAAAYLLSGEIRFALGDHEAAAESFKNAVKSDKEGAFADDAGFAEILAIEAAGHDEDAEKAWRKWEKRYANSPLMSEVCLARSWNALRRNSLGEAVAHISRLETTYPYMIEDPRVSLVQATVAYLQGDPGRALATLGSSRGAPQTYLRGLAHQASGEMLKAAAQYQSVVERYPHSGLRDHAMLAKANVFLESAAYKTAAEEFELVAAHARHGKVVAQAELRRAACVFLDNDPVTSTELLREVTIAHKGTDEAACAQLLLGEVLLGQSVYEDAIREFNRVLSDYFEHELAACAQYRVGQCLDALGRHNEATSAYQLVVSGYPLSPQSPAAAYLAGVGLLDENRPQAAVPYFQLVLDRYTTGSEETGSVGDTGNSHDAGGAESPGEATIVFSTPERQELVEASLCLLEYAYYLKGDLGQLSGVPHLMLQRMPKSTSRWRAYALLIDADALAAQGRYEEAQQMLASLIDEFPDHDVAVPANRLLAWMYARQGKDDLAIQTEERMLARYASERDAAHLSSAYLNKAHILFNRKQYEDAAATYDDFLARFPDHPDRLLALYQSGLCHYRLQHTGDAVDRWEELVLNDPSAEIAERAWARAGDVYFQTAHYEDAKRCYRGLLESFANSRGAALGMLRMAQCDYNAGRDADALSGFSMVVERFAGTGIAREAERGIERALYRLGQREDGTEVLAQLVEDYPTSSFAADAQFEIAMRHYEAESYPEAADAFRRVIRQFPSYSQADRAHFLMADAYSRSGADADAQMAYEQFLMFFPESEFCATVRFRVASMRFDAGDYMRAAVDFSTVVEEETDPEIAAASLFNLAMCWRMLDRTGEAFDTLERYRSLYPADERAVDVAYQLGDIHENAGRTEAAINEYETALASGSNDLAADLHYRLGSCRETLGDDNGAIAAYRKAIGLKNETDPIRLSAVARCAAIYEKKGEYKDAIAAYRDLVQNAEDPELVIAAKERVEQLEAVTK
ncbi:MAG: tetratricopeptide repeat protein [Candidatus Latescibacterota bacterium]|nr:MAG: tetratricopeptide repeat protein [Candidatus Latescibacterota bacterium]